MSVKSVMNLKLMANPLNWVTLAIWLAVLGVFLAGSGITLVPPVTPSQTN